MDSKNLATPNRQQLLWQEIGMYAFVHFTVNTFTDLEWGTGEESVDCFCPSDLDCEQWCRVLSESGFKGAVLTAKHHDGFCLWPSQYTNHSVKFSKWRDGKGDVVAEFAAACRKYGLKMGLYLSPWDRHDERYGTGEPYNQYYRNQLKELLTTYGGDNGEDIFITWFDGACGESHSGRVQEYDFEGCTDIIREYAPNAVIMGHMGDYRDVRWCGNESGFAGNPNWATINTYEKEDLSNGHPAGKHYWPSEVDVSIREGWFFHQNEHPHSLERLLNIYFESVGRGACLNLNIPPNQTGQFALEDIERLKEFKAVLDLAFKENFCPQGEAIAPYMSIDSQGAIFELDSFRDVNVVKLKEFNQKGQRISKFKIEYRNRAGEWMPWIEDETVSFCRVIRGPIVNCDALKFVVTDSLAEPLISFFGAYYMPPVLFAPTFSRDMSGKVTISVSQESIIYYTTDGSTPNQNSTLYHGPFVVREAAKIRAIAVLPEGVKNEYKNISSTAESSFEFGIARDSMRVIDCDSEFDDNNTKENILRDNAIWISRGDSPYPHYIVIDTLQSIKVHGFIYDPGHWCLGIFAKYRLYAGKTQQELKLIAEGYFDNILNNPIPQKVGFSELHEAQYFRFEMEEPLRMSKCDTSTYTTINTLEFF